MRIAIADITIGRRLRDLQESVVAQLMDSIAQIGLQTPISVKTGLARRPGGGPALVSFDLVAGMHRLEACSRLGWSEIDATIVQLDERECRMWEIAENLHRSDLTALERALHISEWIKISKELKVAQFVPPSGGRQPREAGIREAARSIDISRREVQRAGRIAKLHPKAQDEAKRLGCDDHQAVLLAAASEKDKDSQIRVLREMANKPRAKAITRVAISPRVEAAITAVKALSSDEWVAFVEWFTHHQVAGFSIADVAPNGTAILGDGNAGT